ncbi:MAG: hypothetical protein MUE36_14505 [Acidimicrobiales bacterium]|jgi:hypothetical protein|nr:hypothetical protein [Acidimicrobiales bacterium]
MADLRELADDVITSAGRGATPFGLYVIPGNDPAADLGRSVEVAVFEEFFDNSPELLEAEYRPYDDNSLFLVVLDHRLRRPAGVLRILLPHGPIKSLDDIEKAWDERPDDVIARTRPEIDRTLLWDIATLAAMPDYRGSSTNGLITLSLYQGLAVLGTQNGIKWVVAVLDLVVLDLIQKMISRPFQPFRGLEPRRYLDSPSSLPVFLDADDYQPRLAITDPAMYEILFEGRGLEAAVSTPDYARSAHEGLDAAILTTGEPRRLRATG